MTRASGAQERTGAAAGRYSPAWPPSVTLVSRSAASNGRRWEWQQPREATGGASYRLKRPRRQQGQATEARRKAAQSLRRPDASDGSLCRPPAAPAFGHRQAAARRGGSRQPATTSRGLWSAAATRGPRWLPSEAACGGSQRRPRAASASGSGQQLRQLAASCSSLWRRSAATDMVRLPAAAADGARWPCGRKRRRPTLRSTGEGGE